VSVYRFVIASALTVAVFLATAAPADAGQYLVYGCKTRAGKIAPTDGWSAEQTADAYSVASNGCSTGGSLGAALSGIRDQPAGARVGWQFAAPPDTSIDYFDVWRSARTITSQGDVNATPTEYTSWPSANFTPDAREWCGAAWQCTARGTLTDGVVAENNFYSGQLSGITEVHFAAACAGTTTCPARGGGVPMAELRIQAFQVALNDASDPTVDGVRGTLTEAGTHEGVESISFNAKDKGAGLYHSFVDVRKAGEANFTTAVTVPVDTNDGKCVELDYWAGTDREFGWRVPCKLSVAESVDLDTTKLADGTYELRVRVEDAAGNGAVVHGPRSFKIDNLPGPQPATGSSSPGSGPGGSGGGSSGGGGSSVATSVPASNGSRLVLSGARHRSLGFGRATEVAATLRDGAGRAISGASVAVMERMSVPGANWVPARAALTTDADGRVRWTAPPGFSRRIRLAYRANPADASDLATTVLGLTVRSKTTLKGSRSFLRNGGTLRFTGRLLSRPVPRTGVVVELQARVENRWVTFNTQRTGSDGRWKASYRFRATSGLQTYRFRARVRRDTGFPYEPSLSKRISVRVRG